MDGFSFNSILNYLNMAMSSVIVILAFSLLGYTLTYNFRVPVAQRWAMLLVCIVITYASDVALARVDTMMPVKWWLRFQWLGIAFLPAAYYVFSLSVLATTNYRIRRRRWVAGAILTFSTLSAFSAIFGVQIVGDVHLMPPLSYLEAGPYFWLFTVFFALAVGLALGNIWKARQRCLTDNSRKRMTYLLLGFVAPGIGIFPYLISLSRLSVSVQSSSAVLLLALVGNAAVAVLLVVMNYTVAYFGVLTPDRVVRYRLLRFFIRGPVVAILVILAVQTVPTVERILGLPRDIVLFSVITGVIVLSQLFLSVTKSLVDRLVYREDRDEVAWLRELDRRLLTTTDLHQFLENHLITLCELLRTPSGFVAAASGPDLMLEAVVGPTETHRTITQIDDWSDALANTLKQKPRTLEPFCHQDFWIWPLLEPNNNGEELRVLGMLAVHARPGSADLAADELAVMERMLNRVSRALLDRKLQQGVFVALRTIIPDIDRIQQLRVAVPYTSADSARQPADAILNPSPIHSPEFEAWVKDALSHYWGGPKLTRSPLVGLRVVNETMENTDDDPTKALRLVLDLAIQRLKPDGKPDLSAPEWLLYNILNMRFIQGRKVREIADRLAMSESDLYRKQRVAIGQLARVLTEMEQENGGGRALPPPPVPAHQPVAARLN